jgi:peptidyl-prolyl cis-trans isomerase SurA
MIRRVFPALFLSCILAGALLSQQQPPPPSGQQPVFQSVPKAQEPPKKAAAPPEKRVVEEIIARVNNEIVTLTDLRYARESMAREVEEDCRQGCTPQEKQERLAEREKNLLRDLIDQQLLVQRCKDLGINVEQDIVKRLDEVRVKNNLPDMESLQKAVEQSGMEWEEFKNNIRSQLCTQQVMQSEVGRKVHSNIEKSEVQKYYDEHKSEFDRPENVCLSEIFLSTVGKPDSEWPAIEARAKSYLARIRGGEDFYEFAKRYSDGDTARDQQGALGCFERGKLSKEIEDIVFKMKRGEFSDVISTKTGFIILKVEQKYEAGIQPLAKVEPEIMNRLYYRKMQPMLRDYLGKLREESYLVVKPGYTDSAAVATTPIVEIEAKSDANDNGDGKKKDKKKKKKDSE